jgi:alcohol dehydrogenase class IV
VPHGLANAQVMPHVLDLSLEAARERLTELAQMIGRSSAEEFISAVRELNQTVGIPATVEKLKAADFPVITERAIAEADGYPVPYMLGKGDVQSILEKLS